LASTRSVPFWQTLVNANQLANPEMSFWLTREITNANAGTDEFGGIFTLGGTNSSLFTGDIEFLNMPAAAQPSFWLLEMSAVTVNGKSVGISTSADAGLSAIDTGTTLIGGPTQGVDAIFAAIPGSQALTGQMAGFFAFPCATTIAITISFGGKAWPISNDDMNLGTVGNGLCLGGIFDLSQGSNVGSGGGNPTWVVGDTFLKNVYSVFRANPPSVGFAQLSSAAGGSGAPSAGNSGGSGGSSGSSVGGSATFSQTGAPVPTGTSIIPGSASSALSNTPLAASLISVFTTVSALFLGAAIVL